MNSFFCARCERMRTGSAQEQAEYVAAYGSLRHRPFLARIDDGSIAMSISKGRGRHRTGYIRDGELECPCGHTTTIKGGRVIDE